MVQLYTRVGHESGLVFGLACFDADVRIEGDIEKSNVAYGYNGGYIGMHFIF